MIIEKKAFSLTAKMSETAKRCAAFNVCSEISEYDQLLGFLMNIPSLTPEKAIEAYFDGGRHDAERIRVLLERLQLLQSGRKVLEFASGYGRITRHLALLVPDNSLHVSDIHPSACNLLKDKIGVVAHLSTTNPDDLNIASEYDFVFAVSLFSHLPLSTQGVWLRKLFSMVAPGGYLMITTHGDHAKRKQPNFFGENFNSEIGFGFRTESDQSDLSAKDYGTAVVTMPFIYNLVDNNIPGAEILHFKSAEWFELQDEWLISKPAVL